MATPSPHPPEPFVPVRPCMVAAVHERVERGLLPAAAGAPASPPVCLGCFRRVGLWFLAWQALVPAALGRALSGAADYDQRAASSCSGLRSLGPLWAHTRVVCLCDNQAVVACLHSRTTRDSHCMHMLRTLAFVEASHAFSLCPQYISTQDNHMADDLSRDNLSSFLSKMPGADPRATPLPIQLLVLLLDPSLNWASPQWLQQFTGISRRALLPRQDAHTTQP